MGNSGMAKTSIKPNPITALIDPEKKASINAVTSETSKRIYSVAESFFMFMPIGNYIIIVAPPIPFSTAAELMCPLVLAVLV